MARPIKPRRIQINPEIIYFKPRAVPLSVLEQVDLNLDELEAIRFKDLQGLDQKTCAKKMRISVATFQRILNSVHKKIAEALLSGKAIAIKSK